MHLRRHRGMTLMGWALTLTVAAGLVWVVTFGEAYWDNLEVNGALHQAANLCYREADDEKVRDFFFNLLQQTFSIKVEDHGRVVTTSKILADRDDLRIERSQIPHNVHLWFTYSRKVKVPFIGKDREVSFTDHVEQDLSPVKW
jgi:hypothetical protein